MVSQDDGRDARDDMRRGDGVRVGLDADRRSQRVVARPCRHCRAPFAPTRPHQTFCRPSCRWQAFRDRHATPEGEEGDRVFAGFE